MQLQTDQPSEVPKAAELAEVECVYLGQRTLAKGGLAEAWVTLCHLDAKTGSDLDSIEQYSSLFPVNRKAKTPAIVGGIYKMKVILADDGRINTASTSSRQFLRRHPSRDFLAHWDSVDYSHKAKDKSTRQLEKLKADHALENELQMLRAHYHRLPYADRTAFELTVLTFIRKRGG